METWRRAKESFIDRQRVILRSTQGTGRHSFAEQAESILENARRQYWLGEQAARFSGTRLGETRIRIGPRC
jgi:hypothetical protein